MKKTEKKHPHKFNADNDRISQKMSHQQKHQYKQKHSGY